MILDDVYPGFPGDVRNASAYPFPTRYEILEGVDIHRLVVEQDKTQSLAQQVIAPEQVVGILAAQAGYLDDHHLESAGVRLGSNILVSGVLDGGLSEEFDHLWIRDLRTDPPGADFDKARMVFLDVALTKSICVTDAAQVT